ncbi:probable cyclin-dependent serine/threonine-protein kinase DDB_G0292550 [Bacillus rossius redtenbacheri]|uniref:probable cyclin-dependent serine/threonine-protein kinase DDB_G0292550 n=1 Tax=Bacillus rossius redtenbacheri TaxID=93214 RepID=UPI002FDDF8FA
MADGFIRHQKAIKCTRKESLGSTSSISSSITTSNCFADNLQLDAADPNDTLSRRQKKNLHNHNTNNNKSKRNHPKRKSRPNQTTLKTTRSKPSQLLKVMLATKLLLSMLRLMLRDRLQLPLGPLRTPANNKKINNRNNNTTSRNNKHLTHTNSDTNSNNKNYNGANSPNNNTYNSKYTCNNRNSDKNKNYNNSSNNNKFLP